MKCLIRAVSIGRIVPLGGRGVDSGIFKRPLAGAIAVSLTGLAGDEQGDRRHHGGPEKAVHHYPFDHYATWSAEHPDLALHLRQEGAFGENISTEGMTEADVCIGDVFALGMARVAVSQGRQPCWRLNERFGNASMARRVQESGRTGWYYRVLEEGGVAAGDTIELLDRPAEGWTLKRILHLLYRDTLDIEGLAQLAEVEPLAESWRNIARRRLERGAIEDWSGRLNTPSDA